MPKQPAVSRLGVALATLAWLHPPLQQVRRRGPPGVLVHGPRGLGGSPSRPPTGALPEPRRDEDRRRATNVRRSGKRSPTQASGGLPVVSVQETDSEFLREAGRSPPAKHRSVRGRRRPVAGQRLRRWPSKVTPHLPRHTRLVAVMELDETQLFQPPHSGSTRVARDAGNRMARAVGSRGVVGISRRPGRAARAPQKADGLPIRGVGPATRRDPRRHERAPPEPWRHPADPNGR